MVFIVYNCLLHKQVALLFKFDNNPSLGLLVLSNEIIEHKYTVIPQLVQLICTLKDMH